MKTFIASKWVGGMAFETDIEGHKIIVDASQEAGGQDLGVRPKPLMLVALAGCTGMDVVSLLKKMHVDFSEFSVEVEGITSEEHPKKYTEMTVIYRVKGNNVDFDKVEKAVKLSEEKYCGVNAVYKEVVKMNYKIVIE